MRPMRRQKPDILWQQRKESIIGDRLRYIPMGFFNDNSLGNITSSCYYYTFGCGKQCVQMSGHCDRRIFKYSGFLSGAVCDRCASWSDRYYWYSGLPCSNRMLHGSNRKNRPWKTAGAGRTLVKSVLEYVQGMSVVKSYGLEKDNDQAAARAVDDSCKKALALTRSVTPWIGIRQVTAKLFGAALAVASLVFYYSGSLDLSRCILMLIASFMVYQELENAGNMSDNAADAGGIHADTANAIDDTPTMDDTTAVSSRPQDASRGHLKTECFSYE